MAALTQLQRLKTRSQFQAVLAGGTLAKTAHFALHCLKLDKPVNKSLADAPFAVRERALFAVADVWMGALVPKRWAKRAVTRNAIKRQIYSVSQDFAPTLPVAAHVVRLRSGFAHAQFPSATSDALMAAVRQEMQQLFAAAAGRRADAAARNSGA